MSYKVKVQNIYPHLSDSDLFHYKECILGVSIGSPFFERSSIKDILQWCAANFKHTTILIGDALNKYNEVISSGVSLQEAEKKSITLGNRLNNKIQGILNDIGKSSFTIMRWKDLVEIDTNQTFIEEIIKEYTKNVDLKSEIDNHAKSYIDSLKDRKKNIVIDSSAAIELSKSYILEELGVFNILFQKGKQVFLYPGVQLPVLAAFANGNFSGKTVLLDKGIYAQLKISRR
jgi:tRNA-dependent cyclodipeptide synthase